MGLIMTKLISTFRGDRMWRAATDLFKAGLNTIGSAPSALTPGTVISVSGFRVEIIQKLAEGGFAFVYHVRDVSSGQSYALKRLLVNDSEDLNKVKEEISFLKYIPTHRNIVGYQAAGIADREGGGTEVLIVMEFCPEPSLYEILDARFKNYFEESEVLSIFSQVCEGVAHLHSLSPPVVHRDLKVENVLKSGSAYKLCDFGSATTKTYQPTDSRSISRIEDDIQRYTTACYRSPEMIDLWRKQLINEKSDVWALGCLLYRICFFVHPFAEDGNLQILNVNYQIPAQSPYSPQMHALIQYMIEPDPAKRPSVFQVMERLSQLRGVSNPVADHRPQKVSTPSRESGSSQATSLFPPTNKQTSAPSSGGKDLFDMLDWQSSPGAQPNRSSPASTATRTPPSQANSNSTPAAFADFADFSSASFGSSSGAQPFAANFDTAPTSSALPPQPQASAANSFFENSSPSVASASPSSGFGGQDLFGDFVSSPVRTSQSSVPTPTLSSGTNSPSPNDLFSAFGSSNTSPAINSAPVSPAPSRQWNSSVDSLRSMPPSFPHGQMPVSNNNMMMNMNSNMNPNMNMNPHMSMNMSGGAIPTGNGGMNSAFFNSIASAPGQDNSPVASRRPQSSADPFSNLRNL